jgi:pullulanase
MATRLIIDSCTHLIEAYGVDGFRFDLAELLGVEVLRDIEAALKRGQAGRHPDRRALELPRPYRRAPCGTPAGRPGTTDTAISSATTSWAGGAADRLEYFLRGSPWYFAKWPAQTVNYTESHDDRTWIDMITENPGNDGFARPPTTGGGPT